MREKGGGGGNPCEYIDGPLPSGPHAHIHSIAWALWAIQLLSGFFHKHLDRVPWLQLLYFYPQDAAGWL